jgi:hypothetical protein
MTESQIRTIFRETFNNQPNFMTPTVLGYREIDNHLVEISTGDPFLGCEMYGITVLTKTGEKTDFDTCVNSKDDIERYIAEIK